MDDCQWTDNSKQINGYTSELTNDSKQINGWLLLFDKMTVGKSMDDKSMDDYQWIDK